MKLRARLVGLLNGLTVHAAVWTGQAETVVTIQANIDAIDAMLAGVNSLEDQLSLKRKDARKLEKDLSLVADTIEKQGDWFSYC